MTTSHHILIDGTVFEQDVTGVARATIGLYNACLALQPDLRISVAHRGPLKTELPQEWNRIQKAADTETTRWRQQILPALAARLNPDFIHFPWNGGIPRLPRNMRVVMTLHDILPLEIPEYFKTVAGRLRYTYRKYRDLKRATLVITDSYYSRYRIIHTFRSCPDPVVIHLATLLRLPSTSSSSTRKMDYYIYVGGYDPRKGLEQMLDLFYELCREGKIRSRLLLAGTPIYYSDTFKKQIQAGVEQEWVEELGYIDDRTLADMLAGARALIYPSRYEGFGFPPMEAMALGCPVLTTPRTSLPEVCGDAVLYADPDDREEFARCWMELDGDPDLRLELARRGRKRATLFSWDTAARRYLASLETIL